jgi:hypothetical protein
MVLAESLLMAGTHAGPVAAHGCSRVAMGLNGSTRCAPVGARPAPPASPLAVVIQVSTRDHRGPEIRPS